MMIICEKDFEREDPNRPGYSLTEVDYYAWVPAGSCMPNHRLSLRKNLKTGEWEVYRRFFQRSLISRGPVTVITGDDTGLERVAFKSKSLAEAVRFADDEWNRFHRSGLGEKEPDQVCQHKPPVKSPFCKIWEKTPIEEKMQAYKDLAKRRT